VDREDFFNRFELHKNAILYQQVELEGFPENKTLVLDVNLHLTNCCQLTEIKFSFHTSLVNRLDQPSPFQSVYFDRAPNNLMRSLINPRRFFHGD